MNEMDACNAPASALVIVGAPGRRDASAPTLHVGSVAAYLRMRIESKVIEPLPLEMPPMSTRRGWFRVKSVLVDVMTPRLG